MVITFYDRNLRKMALKGIKVIEMLGLAPGPMCGTILADFGATVTVVQKINPSPFDVMSNGKRMLSINLKTKEGIEVMKRLCASADVLLDTYRPGVMEKLGLGPDTLSKENKRLIYARLSGYGQTGKFKGMAGHDINYFAMSGLLSQLKKHNEAPRPPVNLLADFAGGSFTCALGILLALFERSKSGKGQVVDTSMTEGAAYLGNWLFKSRSLPIWQGEPGTNILDGGAPYYSTYKTKDGKYMAVGALEPQFYEEFLKGLRLSSDECNQLGDSESNRKTFEGVFLSKTQDEWSKIFEKLDACVTPVLDMNEVAEHASSQSRDSFYRDTDNNPAPNPAPRLSRTPGVATGRQPMPQPGDHTVEILTELKYKSDQIRQLISDRHVYANVKSNL